MATESSDSEPPSDPVTTINWKHWFYITGAISAIVMGFYFLLQIALIFS